MTIIQIARNLGVGDIDACMAIQRDMQAANRPAIVHLDDGCGMQSGPLDLAVHVTDDDEGAKDVEALLPRIFEFIDEHRPDRFVLVHCTAGASRSPSVALLYLLRKGEIDERKFRTKHRGYTPNPALQQLVTQAENDAWERRANKQ